ncbi:putative Zn-binding protein involved in type VI secretion [Oxalobacteraceae bacterium GrIS 1.11]
MENLNDFNIQHEGETTEQYIFRVNQSNRKREQRTLRGIFSLAIQGARTNWGGEIVSGSSGMEIDNMRVATVGDTVRYPDGTEAKISSGAGAALGDGDKIIAILGSHIDNGDYIIWTPNAGPSITVFMDDKIEGFLIDGYVHPEPTKTAPA